MLRAWPGDQVPAACVAGCDGPAAAVEMWRARFVEVHKEAVRRREELEKLGQEPATTLNVNLMDGDYGALVGWAGDSLVHNLVRLTPPPPPFPLYTRLVYHRLVRCPRRLGAQDLAPRRCTARAPCTTRAGRPSPL
jgi:hypothetical protein